MALYVVPVPAPPIGTDWTYTVPGQYIEHITGITATLTTQNATLAQPMSDISGSGTDGLYGLAGNLAGLSLVPGLIDGDPAVRNAGTFVGQVDPAPDWFAGDFSVGYWVQGVGNGGFYAPLTAFDIGGITIEITGRDANPSLGFDLHRHYTLVDDDEFAFGAALPISTPQFVLWTYDATAGTGTVYQKGRLIGTQTNGPHPMTRTTTRANFGQANPTFPRTYDDIVIFERVLSADDAAALDAAAQAGFGAWSDTVLGLSADAWYPLDGSDPSFSDVVDLTVTDGTHTVLEVPTGLGGPFSGKGPYTYSWQPNLNSSSQTPDGTTSTVALPDLILPAGYTVGTNTLNLGTLDQWSDIFIWWDSGYMDALDPLNAYVFPGGIRLVYQQERP